MTVTTTTTTPTSHQCCPTQSSILALHTTIWCSHIKCSLILDKRNWWFCMNHSYIIKLHWFLGQPSNPHLITCDYLHKNPEYFSSLPWRSCHVLTHSPAAVCSGGRPHMFRLLSRCSAQIQIKFPTCQHLRRWQFCRFHGQVTSPVYIPTEVTQRLNFDNQAKITLLLFSAFQKLIFNIWKISTAFLASLE
jgi:hypothetical protein